MQSKKSSLIAGGFVVLLVSGLVMALPLASAQSTVAVSIPLGAGLGKAEAPGYAPAAITVIIGVNNTVTWQNNDNASHTVTPMNVPSSGSWSVGSGNLPAGQSYS